MPFNKEDERKDDAGILSGFFLDILSHKIEIAFQVEKRAIKFREFEKRFDRKGKEEIFRLCKQKMGKYRNERREKERLNGIKYIPKCMTSNWKGGSASGINFGLLGLRSNFTSVDVENWEVRAKRCSYF